MNSFIVHAARGKESRKCNISLLEVALAAQGFTVLRKKIDGVLVLKQWRNVYIGKTSKCAGNIAKAEARAIIEALEAAGFESAKPLYVAGVFNQPHLDILRILATAKEC